jgi:hypothetical protein
MGDLTTSVCCVVHMLIFRTWWSTKSIKHCPCKIAKQKRNIDLTWFDLRKSHEHAMTCPILLQPPDARCVWIPGGPGAKILFLWTAGRGGACLAIYCKSATWYCWVT